MLKPPVAEKSQSFWNVARSRALLWLSIFVVGTPPVHAATTAATEAAYKTEVQPLLVKYCYDCHGEGMDKGKVAFDEFKSHQEMLGKRDLWLAVLKNTSAPASCRRRRRIGPLPTSCVCWRTGSRATSSRSIRRIPIPAV